MDGHRHRLSLCLRRTGRGVLPFGQILTALSETLRTILMKMFTQKQLQKYFLAKPKSIIEFDLTRKQYLSPLTKLVIKVEIRYGSEEKSDTRPLQIEKRFLVGYAESEKDSLVIHALGSKGLDKRPMSGMDTLSLFLVRRPIFGTSFVLGVIGVYIMADGIDFLCKKVGVKPPFNLPSAS